MKENVVFIRPSKVAGTSMVDVLPMAELGSGRKMNVFGNLAERTERSLKEIKRNFRQRGWVNFGHVDYSLLVKHGHVSKEFDSTAYKFSFVRNPYDRAVSMYFDTKNRGRINTYTTFLRFCQRRIATPFDALGLHSTFGTSAFNPQIRWLENVKLDFLGRYEHLIRDFATLTENLGISYVELPRLRCTEHDHYMNYYCPETLDIVEHAYREDFERYNYPIHNRQRAGSISSQPL